MKVSPRIVDLALIRIFGRTPQVSLSFFELGERWYATGLRSADLHEALHRLSEMRCLLCESSASLRTYRLYGESFDNAAVNSGLLAPVTAEEERTLLALSRRRRSGYRPELGRRADDWPKNVNEKPLFESAE